MSDQASHTTASAEQIVQKVERTHVTYEFLLSDRDFAQLVAAEVARKIPYDDWVSISLEDRKRGVPGVCNVDYTKEHGPTLSILIEADYDNIITRDAIRSVIDDRVIRARRLAQDPVDRSEG